MEYCKCIKESDIATLKSEMITIKRQQTETRDLVIIVTKLVEQFETTKEDVKDIKEDLKDIKRAPLSAVSKIVYMILGVVITIIVTRIMGGV